jgi:Zn-dependent protease
MHNIGLYEILLGVTWVIPVIVAITLHEAGHAFAAYRLGDPTAKLMGRVSLDPVKHIDPLGTILLPGLLLLMHSPLLFGWAKPVPVVLRNLRNIRRDAVLVALAGPAMNVVLAFVSALLLYLLDGVISPERAPWTYMTLYKSVSINCLLAVFNMLPILPLDGGRVLNGLLPPRLAYKHAETERNGMLIVLILFMLPALLYNAHIITATPGQYLIRMPAYAMRDFIFHLAGIGNNG